MKNETNLRNTELNNLPHGFEDLAATIRKTILARGQYLQERFYRERDFIVEGERLRLGQSRRGGGKSSPERATLHFFARDNGGYVELYWSDLAFSRGGKKIWKSIPKLTGGDYSSATLRKYTTEFDEALVLETEFAVQRLRAVLRELRALGTSVAVISRRFSVFSTYSWDDPAPRPVATGPGPVWMRVTEQGSVPLSTEELGQARRRGWSALNQEAEND